MALAFKKGDIVKLKSGGPSMTVIDPQNNDEIICIMWNSNQNMFIKQTFPSLGLEPAK